MPEPVVELVRELEVSVREYWYENIIWIQFFSSEKLERVLVQVLELALAEMLVEMLDSDLEWTQTLVLALVVARGLATALALAESKNLKTFTRI
jgi:Na+(H+)/acetate symporter ActP